jgi:uncharacterized membrane protein
MKIRRFILKLLVLIILAIMGLVCGVISAMLITPCLESCDAGQDIDRIIFSCIFAFCVIGYLAKSWRNWRRFIATILLLSLMTLLTSYLIYIKITM